MSRWKVIVVGQAFITRITTTEDGAFIVDVDNSVLIAIQAWTLEVEAVDLEAAGLEAANRATEMAYDEHGGGPLWACLPIAAMLADSQEA